MMNTVTGVFGGGLLGGALYLMTGSLFVEPPFLDDVEVNQRADQVQAIREVTGEKTVADWRVTVFGHDVDAPYCQTIPGPKLHEGWSIYEPGNKTTEMILDIWVGDPGCYERLTPGEYIEITTWTPRDGRASVTHRRVFTKE